MECVLAKNGRNSSLHNGLKGYLEIATGDPKLVDNLALKGWLRGQSESLKTEYPNMPTDENNEAIVFYHNESVRSDSNNLTLDVAAVADKIDQWKPVFLKDSNSIVQADNPYFLGYVPNDNTIPVFEESIQKLIDRPVALATVPIKEGVPELFESNPELANAVYEALGFKQVYHGSKTTEKYSDYKIPVNKGVDSLGSFFTSDLDGALMFTPDFIDESPIAKDVKERTGRVTYKKDRSYVKKEYLKLQNPYSVDIRKWEDNSWINDFVKGDFSIYNFNEVPSEIVDRVKKILIDRGHDGIYIAKDFYVGNMESRYDQYIVFDPNKTLKQQKQQALQLYSQ